MGSLFSSINPKRSEFTHVLGRARRPCVCACVSQSSNSSLLPITRTNNLVHHLVTMNHPKFGHIVIISKLSVWHLSCLHQEVRLCLGSWHWWYSIFLVQQFAQRKKETLVLYSWCWSLVWKTLHNGRKHHDLTYPYQVVSKYTSSSGQRIPHKPLPAQTCSRRTTLV